MIEYILDNGVKRQMTEEELEERNRDRKKYSDAILSPEERITNLEQQINTMRAAYEEGVNK